jgi:predicted kinase
MTTTGVLHILIGLPGSGKSSFARTLRDMTYYQGVGCEVYSTDDEFIGPGGKYCFVWQLLERNHLRTYKKVAQAMVRDVPHVILDNTNLRRAHRLEYVRLAYAMNYEVEYHVIGAFDEEAVSLYANRCLHGVTAEKIGIMAQGYEPVTDRERFGLSDEMA